ncbi:hypothetical protein [Aquirhabdus parva]|uniref:Uncharacterized protein n=1 Tax=Aquirhabdus parva TaxID=2283318 RepID=A0A345P693_9GAMM|nr:hypothetical protein [Aquirhabdus parva]AXI02802.1 hypothetical protein HYN46_08110 [Aquirhabdus parva]
MPTKPITNKYMKLPWLFVLLIAGLLAYFGGEQFGSKIIQFITQDLIFPVLGFFFSIYTALRIVDHTPVGVKIPGENKSLVAIIIMLVLLAIYLIVPYLILSL